MYSTDKSSSSESTDRRTYRQYRQTVGLDAILDQPEFRQDQQQASNGRIRPVQSKQEKRRRNFDSWEKKKNPPNTKKRKCIFEKGSLVWFGQCVRDRERMLQFGQARTNIESESNSTSMMASAQQQRLRQSILQLPKASMAIMSLPSSSSSMSCPCCWQH